MCGPRTRSLAALALLWSGSALAQEPAGGASAWAGTQLPAYRGRVERFTLAPGGTIDGLLLTDGTEVETPPHLSAQMTAAIRPGDTVTVRGLKAASLALVQALAIEDDETGRAVVDRGPPALPVPARPPSGGRAHRDGRIRVLLHGIRGEVNGFLLDDGTTIRIRPVELSQLAPVFRPGAFVVAEGEFWTSPYGAVLQAASVGARAPAEQASAPP